MNIDHDDGIWGLKPQHWVTSRSSILVATVYKTLSWKPTTNGLKSLSAIQSQHGHVWFPRNANTFCSMSPWGELWNTSSAPCFPKTLWKMEHWEHVSSFINQEKLFKSINELSTVPQHYDVPSIHEFPSGPHPCSRLHPPVASAPVLSGHIDHWNLVACVLQRVSFQNRNPEVLSCALKYTVLEYMNAIWMHVKDWASTSEIPLYI